jgi:hypothetical protein
MRDALGEAQAVSPSVGSELTRSTVCFLVELVKIGR